MKLKDLLNQLNAHAGSISNFNKEWTLHIPIVNQGSIGGTPCVPVKSIGIGFDWDDRKIFLWPEHTLTKLSPEDVADIRASVKGGSSWHAYQGYKQQADKIKALQDEVAELKAKLAERPTQADLPAQVEPLSANEINEIETLTLIIRKREDAALARASEELWSSALTGKS